MTTTTVAAQPASPPEPDAPLPAAPTRGTTRKRGVQRHRSNPLLTALMVAMTAYALLPLVWLVINSTKTTQGLFSSPGLWFADQFVLWDNLKQTFTHQDGIFTQWLLNTVLYAVVGSLGATLIATLGGYGLAKFDFPGKRIVTGLLLASIAVPLTALAVPTFLLFTQLGLTNTYWAVLIPALVSPLGLFLMRVFAQESIPDSLLEAARIDGAGEAKIFFSVGLRLLGPGFVTVLLFSLVATWNNYFLPLIMLSDEKLYPLTVGLNQWNAQMANGSASEAIYHLVLTGSLVAILPLIVCFIFLQKYWQSGLTAGSVK